MKVSFRRAVVLATAMVCVVACGCSSKKNEAKVVQAPPGGGDIAIQVTDKGFEPSRVEVKKGSNATLVFTRTSDRTCAKDIIIAGNGAHLDLPLNEPVRVALGSVNGTVPFECGAHMVKGEIIASR